MLKRTNTTLTAVFGVLCALGVALPATAQDITQLSIPGASIDAASKQISVVVDRGLKRTVALPTRELREARIALLNKEEVAPELLRKLADRRETLAAAKYVAYLDEQDDPALASDVAYYGAIAVGGGRIWVLDEMIEAMYLLDPETEPKSRINQYIRVLYPHAWAGNELALDAVIDFNGEGRLFGPLSEATRTKIIAQIDKNGTARGDLKMAISILRLRDLTNDDIARARVYLERAKTSDHLAVATTAANLIEQLADKKTTTTAATN